MPNPSPPASVLLFPLQCSLRALDTQGGAEEACSTPQLVHDAHSGYGRIVRQVAEAVASLEGGEGRLRMRGTTADAAQCASPTPPPLKEHWPRLHLAQ